ncbi:flotillin family protein [Campylobacter sp. MOP51]|uniref:flotillin family protein n=1 Tax=Campylobacter canis TaxID=3378588 RepID=UPI003C381C5D
MDQYIFLTVAVIGSIIGLIVVGVILSKLYKKTTKELAFVRTGFGGEKVVTDGGAFIFPILHDYISVSMQTLKLTVVRIQKDSLITQDRMRVDITTDFYVRVKQDKESISIAAQTLGSKTTDARALKELIEGKFVDALRSVASSMKMSDLHEKRADFVQQVQSNVYEDLLKNGLELESVSLTSFDQTELEYFNESNAFDAEGLTILKQTVENKRKERNDIEKQTNVAIEQKNLETTKELLVLQQTEAEAEAEQKANIEKVRAEKHAEAEKEKILREKEIESARIEKEKTIQEAEIAKKKALESAEISKEKDIAIATQDKQIEISKKSEQEYEARSKANEKKAEEAKSAEKIKTAQETEQAERIRSLAIIEAQKEAEEKAIGIKVAAEAEKEAATNRAEAVKIEAQGKSNAIKIMAEADEKRYKVEAEGKEKLNNAENILSETILENRIKQALIAKLPEIIKEVVAPMQKIDSIKIVDMGGGIGNLASGGGSAVSSGGADGASLSDQIVNAALKFKTNAPILNDLMSEVGLNLNSVSDLTSIDTSIKPLKQDRKNAANLSLVAEKNNSAHKKEYISTEDKQ